MRYANSSFISSTFWTDRVGPAAALKTLEIMEKTKSWKEITKKGIFFKKKLLSLAKRHKLKIKIQGLNAMPKFEFNHKDKEYFTTYITQEMLKRKILASNSIYFCINHNEF